MIGAAARRLLDGCEAEVTAALGVGPGLYGGASRTWHPAGCQVVVTVHEHAGSSRPHVEATVAHHIRGACLGQVETLRCATGPRAVGRWVAETVRAAAGRT